MDFRYPTPATGTDNHWFKAATERLNCDMVICLNGLHHLARGVGLSFKQITEGLESFTSRWLLLEMIGPDDEWGKKYGDCDWYREDNLIKALEARFSILRRLPSDQPSRTLFLCEKKQDQSKL